MGVSKSGNFTFEKQCGVQLYLVLNIIPGLGCSPNRLTLIKWPPPRTSPAHSHVTIRLNRAVHMYRNMRNANMPDACCSSAGYSLCRL